MRSERAGPSWRAIAGRLSYANVMSTLAVVIVLGSGTAYAAVSIVDRARLANNSLALGGLPAKDYRQDVSTASSSTKVTAAPGKWVTVLAWKFTSHAPRPGPMTFLNQVTLTNAGKAPGQAQLRLVLNGKTEEGATAYQIGITGAQTIFGLLVCNGMPAGVYAAQLQVLATGTSLIINTSDEFALRPIVIPP